ncbi:MAG: ATPase [Gammaproteobacteria bacterium]|nr:ATPase [Gammaproteobacteria bacterium]
MAQPPTDRRTRLIFIGGPTLTDGFRLVGFETLVDPEIRDIDRLIEELLETPQNAFIVFEQSPEMAQSKLLQQVRNEGGRIVVSEVPALQDPTCFHCDLDRQIERLMGSQATSGGTL